MARKINYLKSTGSKEVDDLMAQFNYAYLAALPHFERMERIQNTYDNQISVSAWPTIAQISIPLTFMSVEEQLPFAMKYMFPKNRFISLLPSERLERDRVKRVEDNIRRTLRVTMDIESACHPSIRDCYKFAVGYGLVDTDWITPPEVRVMQAEIGGEVISTIPEMAIGKPKQIPCYYYLSPIQVIPMPDGSNVEGPNRASGHFVIIFPFESEFRDMYTQKGLDGRPILQGDPDAIVKQARNLSFHVNFPAVDMIASIAGLDLNKSNTGDDRMPVVVPIIRYYSDHKQVWIANGKTKIYEAKDTYQTLRSDLVKWSAWPDGNRWFPLGVTEASEKVALGTNLWYNGLVDLAMYHINPVRMINTKLIDNPHEVARSPRSDVKVNGDPNQALAYAELPQFPQQLFSMGEMLQRFHANANGIMTGAQERAPGLVRGGANALEELMSSSTGRQYLAAIAIKCGGLKPLIEKVIIKKQLLMDENGDSFVEKAYDPQTNEVYYDEHTVTLDDMRNVFEVELDMPAASINSVADAMARERFFDRASKQPELFDQRALYEELTEDDAMIRRVMLSDNVVRQRQERMAEANIRNTEMGATQNRGMVPQPAMQGRMVPAI